MNNLSFRPSRLLAWRISFSLALLLFAQTVWGQPANPCPGWRNPTTFVTGNLQFFYSGQVIESLNSSTGSGGMAGTVGVDAQFYTGQPVVPAAQLATKAASCSCTLPDGTYRFRIKTPGTDPNTSNQLNFVPPFSDNEGHPYTHSIRVGTNCDNGGEALYYQMHVTPENALLTVWYAAVIESPGHTYDINPGFIIRIKEKVSGQWVQTDPNLDYVISGTPQSASFPQGMVNGQNGWHLLGSNTNGVWYKDWTKVIVSLNEYMYKDVRIEVYMSACKYNAHYGYSYITGDYQAMEVTSSGCPSGTSTVVDTLRAPKDMQSYRWYKSRDGFNISGQTYNTRFLDSMANGNIRTTLVTADGLDTIVWVPVTNTSTNREYQVQAADFNLTGPDGEVQTIGVQSFMCKMMSYMDPAKPFASYVFQPVENNKPQLAIDTIISCEKKITLFNKSHSPNRDLDTNLTTWRIYETPVTEGEPLATFMGQSAEFHAPHAGTYYADLWACTVGDSSCNTRKAYPVRVLERPVARIGAVPTDQPCIGDEIHLVDSTFLGRDGSQQYDNWSRHWRIAGRNLHGSAIYPQENVAQTYTESDTVQLIVNNGLFYLDREHTADTVWCSDTAQRVISVFAQPQLAVSDDTIVCKGSRTHVTVSTDLEGDIRYSWYEHLDRPGEQSVSEGPVLEVMPPDDCDYKTYYVKVTRMPQGCVAWDSITIRMVKPVVRHSRGEICQGDTVTLWGENAHHYSWAAAPGDTSLIPQQNEDVIVVSPQRTTTYTMVGHGSDDCDAAPLTQEIVVLPYPVPTVSLSPGFVDSEDPTVTFTDVTPSSVASTWDFGNGNVLSGATVSFKFEDLNLDSVYVSLNTANRLNCASDTTFSLPIQRFSAYIPNVFTPSAQYNNEFRIITANKLEFFSIYIYDRRGMLVFSSESQDFVWDGTVYGEGQHLCPQGSYVYICRYRRPGTTDLVSQQGTITIIR